MINKKNKIKLVYFVLIIILILTIFFIIKKIYNKDNRKEEIITSNTNEILLKFNNNYPKALAYLSLNQFLLGLTKDKKAEYEFIFPGSSVNELYIEEIFKGYLGTVSLPLMQGAVDVLGKALNQKIQILINNKSEMQVSTTIKIDNHKAKNDLFFKLKNEREHFFINSFEDTKGDGYCFFHAVIHLLNEKRPDWKEMVFSNNKIQILKEQEIKDIASKL